MVYVQRDSAGKLLRISETSFPEMTGDEPLSTEDVSIWLRAQQELHSRLEILHRSDLATIRVLEDLVNLLVEKNVITYQELPETARKKLDERALVRADLEAIEDTFKFSQYSKK
jgi:hypothetical protein